MKPKLLPALLLTHLCACTAALGPDGGADARNVDVVDGASTRTDAVEDTVLPPDEAPTDERVPSSDVPTMFSDTALPDAALDVSSLPDARPTADVPPSDSRPMDVPLAMDVRPITDVQPIMDVQVAMDVQPPRDVVLDAPTIDSMPPTMPVVLPAHYASLRTAQVWATVQAATPSITLRWASVQGRSVSAVAIDRKALDATSWGTPIAMVSGSTTEWTDTSVTAGTLYEYRVRLTVPTGTAYGYVVSGVDASIDAYQGRIAIVVDASLQTQLAAELATLQTDLYGDGWIPVVVPVARTATPASVRMMLVGLRSMYSDLRAAYLVGHVPVAYAGNNNPDGHGSGRVMGADGYYGELTSSWNGSAGCANAPQQATLIDAPNMNNTFCNGDFPSTLELAVGRADFANLPTFASDEVTLLRAYLNKVHAYKIRQTSATVRAFIKDGLGEAGYGTGIGAWSTYPSLVGPSSITVDNSSSTFLFNLLNDQSHVFVFGSYFGGGCNGSANGVVGSTPTVRNVRWGGVFNHTIGSYFGEFNCTDSFLRGLLASGNALSHTYNALHWYYHPMAMGQTLGSCALRTMNNKLTGTYTPVHSSIASSANTHLGLMGDPSLRMQYLSPPSALTLANQAGKVRANWTASTETGLAGYHVYQVTASGITRLTNTPITTTTFTSNIDYAAGLRFVVRAIRRTTTPSGSYWLPSVGAVATTP